MKRFYAAGFVALCLAACPMRAQQAEPPQDAAADPLAAGAPRIGAHLYSASIFGDYFSGGLPSNFGTPVAALQSDVAYGGSISMGWAKIGPRVNASVNYTPTFTGRMRYSDLHSFGHDLNMSASFEIKPKLTLRVGALGAIRDQQRVLFGSTQAALIASSPATFNGLASAVVTGQYANAQLASLLTAPSLVNPAAGNILYGTRYLTTGLNFDVTYAHSERLQITAGLTGSRSQSLGQNTLPTGPQPLLPHSTTAGTRVSVNYGLTQRLNLAGSWSGQRSFQYQQGGTTYSGSLIHNVNSTLGYIAGTKWMFSVGGGIGFVPSTLRVSTTNGSQNTLAGKRYLANASVTYKFFSQTLTATGLRTVSNSYGFGGGAVVTGDLAWHWNRPGSGWGMTLNGGYQSFEVQGANSVSSAITAGASNLTGWRGVASLNRMLSRRLSCGVDYSVLRNIGNYTGVNYALTRSAARVVLTWSFTDQMGPGRNDSNF